MRLFTFKPVSMDTDTQVLSQTSRGQVVEILGHMMGSCLGSGKFMHKLSGASCTMAE